MNKSVNAMILDRAGKPETIHPLFRYVAYFCLIDLLVLPYFPLLIMPYSLPVVLLALVLLRKMKVSKFHLYSVIIVSFLMMLSVATAIAVRKPSEFLREDFLRVFQFVATFAYFFYFCTVAKYLSSKVIKRIMMMAAAYIVLIAIGFLTNPSFLVALREHVYTATAYRIGDVLEHLRFTYMFSDPNTAGYFFLILVLFMLVYFKNSLVQSVLLLASAFLATIIAQSTGVAISLVGAAILVLLKASVKLDIRSLRKTLTLAIGLCLLFAFVEFVFPGLAVEVSRSVDMFVERISFNQAETRLAKYPYAVTHFMPFLWGQGYTLLGADGSVFNPHSDHLRVIYSYGVVVYAILMLFLFRKFFRSEYLFLFPALMAFSVNSLIAEQKLFGLFLVLLALADVKNRQNRSSVKPKALIGE